MELKRGDLILAQEMTGKSYETVRQTAAGRRNNKSVIKALEIIVENRKQLIRTSKNQ